MPEYKCVNIGEESFPVWLTLNEKAIIAVIEPMHYLEAATYNSPGQSLLRTVVTLVVNGCAIEVKTPATVDKVCRILGFVWDEKDVVEREKTPAPPEPEKAKGENQ